MLLVSPSLRLPDGEVRITFGPSRGPGGQNVNKVNTCAILTFDISSSRSLSESQREMLRRALGSRISLAGELQLRSDRYRTQGDNRRDVLRRFVALLGAALRPPKRRRPTKPTIGSRHRRRRLKEARSARKRDRRAGGTSD